VCTSGKGTAAIDTSVALELGIEWQVREADGFAQTRKLAVVASTNDQVAVLHLEGLVWHDAFMCGAVSLCRNASVEPVARNVHQY